MAHSTPQSPVRNPEEMNAAFAAAYNSGDIANLLALYEPEGILISPRGGREQGVDRIRATLEDLLRLQGTMISKNVYCIPFENIALLRAHFILHATNPDGSPMQLEGHTSEIVRKQPDGSWLYIVDHPFGADKLAEITE